MGRIHLVRHGQANLLGDDYDQLSDTGLRQAWLTGKALAAQGVIPGRVLSGRLIRQSRTAQAMIEAAGWAAACEADPDFDEFAHADLFTPAFPDLVDHAALAARVSLAADPRRAFQDIFEQAFLAWVAGRTGAGIAWADFRARAVAAVGRVAVSLDSGQSAVIVSSGGVIAAICQHLLDVPDDAVLRLHNPIHNASITRLMTRGAEISISGFNDISHLSSVRGEDMVTYR